MSRRSRSDAAFSVYLDLGPVRSLASLRDALKADPALVGGRRAPSLRTLESWSALDRWSERVLELERQAREDEDRAHVERVKQHRARLRQEGMFLQQRGIAWLRDKDADGVRAGEAVRAIAEGFRIEALGLGEVTDRVAIDEGYGDVFDRLSDAELKRLVEILRAPPAEGALGAGETGS